LFVGALEDLGAPDEEGCGESGHQGEGGGDGQDAAGAFAELLIERHRATGLNQFQVASQNFRGRMALGGVWAAGLQHDAVDLAQEWCVGMGGQLPRDSGVLALVHAGRDLIEHLTKAVDIRRDGAWAFGRQIPGGADAGERGIDGRDEPDIGEFGGALDKDDIRGLDVAVDEILAVEDGEAAGEFEGELDAFVGGEAAASADHFPEGQRDVAVGVDSGSGFGVIGRFHDVVEVSGLVIAADMEEGELARAT